MVTNIDKQQINLHKKIEKYFIATKPYLEQGFCPTKNLLATALDKWSLLCVFNLGYYDTLRFNELKRKTDGISSRMLAVTLKNLESFNIVQRKAFPEIPPKVEYSLTQFGFELSGKIIDLGNWLIINSNSLK